MLNNDPASNDPALSFDKIEKTFVSATRQVHALRNVTLTVRPSGVTGLIGPDGAGKTTLMRLATGLLVPDAGHIHVLGIDVLKSPLEVQANIGYMPQRFGLYEDLTVQQNLDLYADLQGVLKAARPARYDELMKMTGLKPFSMRLAGQLSGGMKQKLGLACTLIHPPRLLLLDEPTVGVDPVSRRELWRIVYRLVQDVGMTVLLSTAYLNEAEHCDAVILLHEGAVLAQDSPQAFSQQMDGRSFLLRAPGVKNRLLQEQLRDAPSIVDAVIERGRIRLVMASAEPPKLESLLPAGSFIEPITARFEDYFVAELRARQTPRMPNQTAHASTPPAHDEAVSVIQVRDVERRFGDFYAVKNISFAVRRGEIFGLLGANGAGKTTTFRMLCGLLPATGGSLTVADLDLRRAAAKARARLGYMAQKFSLYGNLSVLQNLQFFSASYGLVGRRRRQRLDWALDEFALSPVADANSGELSLGYKQRLALACALMHEPDILFLDEPTSGVDPLARREFWRRINLLAEAGVTVLITTHFMEEAEYCDRLAIMAAGEILTLGEPEVIKAATRTPDQPDPSLEDAFIALIERRQDGGAAN